VKQEEVNYEDDLDETMDIDEDPALQREGLPRKSSAIDYYLIRFIACTNQPLVLVENPFFKDFVESLNRSYKIPCRTTVSKKIVQMRHEKETEIKTELDQINHAVITCDNWTSISNQSYLGLTVHYINSAFKMCSKVLGLKYVEGNNSGKSLKEKIDGILAKWNLDGKVKYVVSDNGSNIKLAIGLMKGNKSNLFM
jgi:hypothetical protein